MKKAAAVWLLAGFTLTRGAPDTGTATRGDAGTSDGRDAAVEEPRVRLGGAEVSSSAEIRQPLPARSPRP
jgi:hypothetical protein